MITCDLEKERMGQKHNGVLIAERMKNGTISEKIGSACHM